MAVLSPVLKKVIFFERPPVVPPAPPGTFTTLDPAKHAANLTLDGTNLIVTGATGQGTALSLQAAIATKTCVEVKIIDAISPNNLWWGYATGDSDYGNDTWPGSSQNKAGQFISGFGTWYPGHTGGDHDAEAGGFAPVEGDTILMECDYSQTPTTDGEVTPQGCWRFRWQAFTSKWFPLPKNTANAADLVFLAVGVDTNDILAVQFDPALFAGSTPTPTAGFVGMAS